METKEKIGVITALLVLLAIFVVPVSASVSGEVDWDSYSWVYSPDELIAPEVPCSAKLYEGVKFYDSDCSGSYTAGEEFLNGWEIVVEVWDGDSWEVYTSDVTHYYVGQDGRFMFTLPVPGWTGSTLDDPIEYRIKETPQSGWIQSAPALEADEIKSEAKHKDQGLSWIVAKDGYYYLLEMGCGAGDCDLLFGNHELFCIDGYKINDCTCEGIEGWEITLYDEGGCVVATTTTDCNGYYQFCGLEPGDYTVSEGCEEGWYAVSATSVDVTLVCDDVVNVNFYNAPLLCIEGYKINDCTCEGIEGWEITLYDEGGCVVATTTTDCNGYYQFCGLEPGDYTVSEGCEEGWYAVSATSVDVTLVCDDVVNVNFYNAPLLCIEGYKINYATDEGLEGWVIELYDESGALIDTATTDACGYYQFCGLGAGCYEVREVEQDGWSPVGDTCLIVCVECEDSTGNNFYNEPSEYYGCTPGFWKNHPASWPVSTGTTIGEVFEVCYLEDEKPNRIVDPDDTLMDALNYKGGDGTAGKAQILLRAATAAYLNSETTGWAYPYSTDDLVLAVNYAMEEICDGDVEPALELACELDHWNNELPCPDCGGNDYCFNWFDMGWL